MALDLAGSKGEVSDSTLLGALKKVVGEDSTLVGTDVEFGSTPKQEDEDEEGRGRGDSTSLSAPTLPSLYQSQEHVLLRHPQVGQSRQKIQEA